MKKTLGTIVGLSLLGIFTLSAHDDEGKLKGHKHLLKKADVNNDNKISQEEWSKFHGKNFTAIDKNGDGSISEDELKTHHEELEKESKKK